MNTVRLTPIIDEDDVTELVELDARSVHGVRTPASGSPFALMKSARDEPGVLHLSAGDASQAEIDAFMAKAGYRRADGAAKSASAEADAILQAVSGERDPREEVQRRHLETGQFVSGEDSAVLSAQELARAERELEASDDPDERDKLAQEVTLGRLRALYGGTAPAAPDIRKGVNEMGTAMKSQVNLPAAIKRLEQLHPQLPQGRLREEVGEELAKCRLMTLHAVKSVQKETRAEAERRASNEAVRAAQEKASTPAPKARRSSPRAALEGVRDGSAPVQSLGLQSRSGAVEQYDPHAEPDPLVQAAVIEDELAKASDPLVRQRLGEDLTVARLKALHGGSRLAAPRALAKAAKGGKKARKAAKRAAALR